MMLMRHTTTSHAACLLLLVVAGTAAAQPAPVMVKDIRPGLSGPEIGQLTAVNNVLYFLANESLPSGIELWRSDGTEQGTRLVKDIHPGGVSSEPRSFTVMNGILFFTANDGSGRELWRTDGTAAGTVMVVDLSAVGRSASAPDNLTVVNATLYFAALVNGSRQLWRSDGTASGTQLVRGFSASEGEVLDIATAGSSVFLRTKSTNGVVTLWKSDGSASGTVALRSFPGSGRLALSPRMLGIGSTLYFTGYDESTAGQELWKSDGTAAGTVMVADLYPGMFGTSPNSSSPQQLTAFAGRVVFVARTPSGGGQVFISDGTAAGTAMFFDRGGVASEDWLPLSMVELGGRLLFIGGQEGYPTRGLWSTDGTYAGTYQIAALSIFQNYFGSLVRVGDGAYFAASPQNVGALGSELWVTDGTPHGTSQVADIYPGIAMGSWPSSLTAVGDVLFFTANDGVHNFELWRLGDPVVESTDLQISMFANPSFVTSGDPLTYNITVANVGTNVASSAVVTAALPVGFAVTNCGAPLGNCTGTGATRSISFASIGAGETRTATITGTVTANAGATLTHSVSVSSLTPDPVSSNDVASVAMAVSQGSDIDSDDLPDDWERRFGLQTGSSTGDNGRLGDPDGDGRTNVQELADGTHPRGTFGRFLSEGATGTFFRTRLSLLNPRPSPAKVLLRFLKSDGATVSHFIDLAGRSRATVEPHLLAGLGNAEFSTLLEADGEVVVDRTMTWGEGYGSHAESGVPTPSPTWYLAEGSTVGPFNLFYLLQNPSLSTPATVRVTFLLPTGGPVVKSYVVPANSRQNIWVDDIPELSATDVSAVLQVTAGPDIIVERAMYLDRPGQPFAAGHESAGITAPATQWFFAEGATGAYFDEFILIANPHPTVLTVRATFLLPSGETLTKDYAIAGNSRFNIWVDEETFPGLGKALADTAVSVTLESINGVTYIAERAMWWPGPTSATWAEAHNSPGTTTTGTAWALADGEVGNAADTETFILVANTSTEATTVMVTLFLEDGRVLEAPFVVGPRSRFNVWVRAEFPLAVNQRFGALVESEGQTPGQLVVERAMYSNAGGTTWAAGTNALATRLR